MNKSKEIHRATNTATIPTYSQFISILGEPADSSYSAETEKIETLPNSEADVVEFLLVSSPPQYSIFLIKGEELELVDETGKEETSDTVDLLETVNLPTYKTFLEFGDHYESELLTDITEPVTPALLVSNLPTYKTFISRSETDVEAEKSEKTRWNKAGLFFSVIASILGWLAIVLALVGSRNLEWFMFAPAAVAAIFAITGERLNKNSERQYYVNTVVFSIFSLVFPFILLAIGWLQTS